MNSHHDSKRKKIKMDIDLQYYWVVLWSRKKAFLVSALPLFAIVMILTFLTRPIYTAKGTLLIQGERNILSFEQMFQVDTYQNDYYQTQYKLLESRSLAERTIQTLKLQESEESEKMKREEDTRSFLKRLDVKPIRNTRLVELSFKDHDPEYAANAVNTLFDSYIEMSIDIKAEATEEATAFLGGEIEKLQTEIEELENELQEFGTSKDIIALSESETTIVETLAELNRAITEARLVRLGKEAYYNEIQSATPDYIPEAIDNLLIQKLREEYVKLKREYTSMQETYKPEYPGLKQKKAELEEARDSLQAETQSLISSAYSDYQAALRNERSIERQYKNQEQRAIEMNSSSIIYNSKKIEIENKQDVLETLMTRQSETALSARLKNLKSSNLRVIDKAEVPIDASSPKTKLNMILGLLLGLFGGTGTVFLLNYLDNSVNSIEDVEETTGIPLIGVIPTLHVNSSRLRYNGNSFLMKINSIIGSLKNNAKKSAEEIKQNGTRSIELITHFLPESSFAEQYRSIRTALLLSSPGVGLKSFVVSSSLAREGKSTTLCNLAITFAQANKSVLIIDADLRKPKLHKIFKMKNINGLTNFLSGNKMGDNIKGLVKETQIPNLFFINAGPVPTNPMDLLESEKMAKLVEIAKHTFDYVFFDSPPSLPVSDSVVLGLKTDGVILVVWGGSTTRETLKKAKEKFDLHKVKTTGVIINNLNLKGYDYYYRHQTYRNYY